MDDPRENLIGTWRTRGQVYDAEGAATETFASTDAYAWLDTAFGTGGSIDESPATEGG